MNIKSNEWTLVKVWLSFNPFLTVSEIAEELRKFRIRYGV